MWTVQPTVYVRIGEGDDNSALIQVNPLRYLAIAAAVGAAAIRFAKAQAVPLAWWYRALNGSTIRQLENQYEASQGILSAIANLADAPLVSVASILTALMIIVSTCRLPTASNCMAQSLISCQHVGWRSPPTGE